MTLRGVRWDRRIELAGGIFVGGQNLHFSLGDGKMAHAVFPRAGVGYRYRSGRDGPISSDQVEGRSGSDSDSGFACS